MNEANQETLEIMGEGMYNHLEAKERTEILLESLIKNYAWCEDSEEFVEVIRKIIYRGLWYEQQYGSIISYVKDMSEEHPIYD